MNKINYKKLNLIIEKIDSNLTETINDLNYYNEILTYYNNSNNKIKSEYLNISLEFMNKITKLENLILNLNKIENKLFDSKIESILDLLLDSSY